MRRRRRRRGWGWGGAAAEGDEREEGTEVSRLPGIESGRERGNLTMSKAEAERVEEERMGR